MDSAGLVTVDLSVAQLNANSAHISPFQVRVKLGRRIMNQAISQFLPAAKPAGLWIANVKLGVTLGYLEA